MGGKTSVAKFARELLICVDLLSEKETKSTLQLDVCSTRRCSSSTFALEAKPCLAYEAPLAKCHMPSFQRENIFQKNR